MRAGNSHMALAIIATCTDNTPIAKQQRHWTTPYRVTANFCLVVRNFQISVGYPPELEESILTGINRANAWSNEGETERSLDRLGFEGYRWADSVRVDGLKKSQNATGKMGIKSENIGGKPVMTRDTGKPVAKCDAIAFCDNREGFIGTLVHYTMTRKRDDSIFRSSRFTL